MADQGVVLQIQGMSCGHCVSQVRKALERLDGVTVRRVEIGEAVVEIDPTRRSTADLLRAIDEAGYEAAVR